MLPKGFLLLFIIIYSCAAEHVSTAERERERE